MEQIDEFSSSVSGEESHSSSPSVEIITDEFQTTKIGSTDPTSQASSVSNLQKVKSRLNAKANARDYHKLFLNKSTPGLLRGVEASNDESKTTPLFSGQVLEGSSDATFCQYGLLAAEIKAAKVSDLLGMAEPVDPVDEDNRIFLNVSTPWSAFICGSQGSGKSHTLSCMLENCLLPSKLGKLEHPLAAMVFHYDKFTSYGSNQICEAAYLCSSGVPVKVLVSPTNYWKMKATYENLPGLQGTHKLEVIPMRFTDKHLDVTRILNLMAVSNSDSPMPLYMEVILRILRDMAINSRGSTGLDYNMFRGRLEAEGFTDKQNGPLKLRLELLESFMERPSRSNPNLAKTERAWKFEPGTLTIVDLSCPFVDDNVACALFNICLELFLESRSKIGRVVALDEAHKFMNSNPAASTFTDTLLDVIRQQRHLATRVIISTQEPTISPKLLDLSSMTIVHRFTSPQWLTTLRDHLAGASGTIYPTSEHGDANDGATVGKGTSNPKRDVDRLFAEIVVLEAGEALLFSPSAILELEAAGDSSANDFSEGIMGPYKMNEEASEQRLVKPVKLGMKYVKMRVRARLTADGGKSIMAE